jgi:hypothetical protein
MSDPREDSRGGSLAGLLVVSIEQAVAAPRRKHGDLRLLLVALDVALWAMMLFGFAGLALAGYRRAKSLDRRRSPRCARIFLSRQKTG